MYALPHRHLRIFSLALLLCLTQILVQSCGSDTFVAPQNTVEFAQRLSEYHIFQGTIQSLVPSENFVEYRLPAALFSDNSEKQRLIALPAGKKLTYINDELPDFPDQTMLVKTFYYFNDKRDVSKGKKIIETRLLVKQGTSWNVATYRWNAEQTEATLTTSGFDTNAEWIDEKGIGRTTSYHVPNNRECATCHQANGVIQPIGPKMRNLNTTIVQNGTEINQLRHLLQKGVLPSMDLLRIGSVPHPGNTAVSLQERSRAYLDINCAHCHKQNGYAANQGLDFAYSTALAQTGISANKNNILTRMRAGTMPLLGTFLSDEEGIRLLNSYFETLP